MFYNHILISNFNRLWDVYILEGDPVLLAMALNIMKMHEKSIRKLQMENFMDFIQNTLASNFGYSDDETMFSLREVLSKLKSDGLHILPPPRPDDLPEVPTKALGPILSRPISSIREEQEEIKSRRSHAAYFVGSRACSPCSVLRVFEVCAARIPSRRMPPLNLQHVPPPDPRQNTPTGFSHNRSVGSDGFEVKQPTPQLRTSMMRDEHTGKMVTVVRGDDDDFEDSRRSREQPASGLDGNWRDPRRQADRVLHTQNNVTIITLGDDSVI
ncbi:hypothetical protein TELCIR_06388 [Teladorsagia circumcincta]|uniref:Rab-GAP TBC domain-containing protein n=1 Tax=Teladorsagia circumcincta TaxID=45464 RepID=A0A2G9UNH9_TELCI|nr:hypothetical protein TELCIR_06388 [Teladorsagia circumcincta]